MICKYILINLNSDDAICEPDTIRVPVYITDEQTERGWVLCITLSCLIDTFTKTYANILPSCSKFLAHEEPVS